MMVRCGGYRLVFAAPFCRVSPSKKKCDPCIRPHATQRTNARHLPAGSYEFRPDPEHRPAEVHRGRSVVLLPLPPSRAADGSRAQLRGILRVRLHAGGAAAPRVLHVAVLQVHALEADDILPRRADIGVRGGGGDGDDRLQAEPQERARFGHSPGHQ